MQALKISPIWIFDSSQSDLFEATKKNAKTTESECIYNIL